MERVAYRRVRRWLMAFSWVALGGALAPFVVVAIVKVSLPVLSWLAALASPCEQWLVQRTTSPDGNVVVAHAELSCGGNPAVQTVFLASWDPPADRARTLVVRGGAALSLRWLEDRVLLVRSEDEATKWDQVALQRTRLGGRLTVVYEGFGLERPDHFTRPAS